MSEIGTLTGEDPAERVEMALGKPITSMEQSPERTVQEGESRESHNNCTIQQAACNSNRASDNYTLYLFT